jgi:hypothetical protein
MNIEAQPDELKVGEYTQPNTYHPITQNFVSLDIVGNYGVLVPKSLEPLEALQG